MFLLPGRVLPTSSLVTKHGTNLTEEQQSVTRRRAHLLSPFGPGHLPASRTSTTATASARCLTVHRRSVLTVATRARPPLGCLAFTFVAPLEDGRASSSIVAWR